MNIILVDDDLDDVLLFRQAIKDISKTVNCVELGGGRDLLNYLEVTPYKPRMIFLDYNMPGMNGWEFLEEYKKFRSGERNFVHLDAAHCAEQFYRFIEE